MNRRAAIALAPAALSVPAALAIVVPVVRVVGVGRLAPSRIGK